MTGGNVQRGLTLVEMLVVLMVVGLVMAILFSALFQLQSQQASTSRATLASRDFVLNTDWVVEGLRGFFVSRTQGFTGRGTEIVGFSIADLSGELNPSVRQRWRLVGRDGGVDLLVASEQQEPMRYAFDGVERAQFSYIDAAGATSVVWPVGEVVPDPDPMADDGPPIPTLVVLTLTFLDGSPSRVIVGAPHQVGRKSEFRVPTDEE